MAKQTPQEVMESKLQGMEYLVQERDRYQSLENEVSLMKEKARLGAKAMTSKLRAKISWQDRLEGAKALINATKEEIATVLSADSLLSKATRQGELEAEKEATQSESQEMPTALVAVK